MQTQGHSAVQNLNISDSELVQQALTGDQQAFESLVRRYSTPLFNFIYHFFHEYDSACDILQQVFLQLYLSLPTLYTGKPLKSWLFRTAKNRCIDELRKRRAIYFSELESANGDEELSPLAIIPDDGPLPEELAEQHDLQQYLHRAIQALPPKFCTIVLLRYAGQMSFSEIGHTLEIPESTAKTYFQRAKRLLRRSLSMVA